LNTGPNGDLVGLFSRLPLSHQGWEKQQHSTWHGKGTALVGISTFATFDLVEKNYLTVDKAADKL